MWQADRAAISKSSGLCSDGSPPISGSLEQVTGGLPGVRTSHKRS